MAYAGNLLAVVLGNVLLRLYMLVECQWAIMGSFLLQAPLLVKFLAVWTALCWGRPSQTSLHVHIATSQCWASYHQYYNINNEFELQIGMSHRYWKQIFCSFKILIQYYNDLRINQSTSNEQLKFTFIILLELIPFIIFNLVKPRIGNSELWESRQQLLNANNRQLVRRKVQMCERFQAEQGLNAVVCEFV